MGSADNNGTTPNEASAAFFVYAKPGRQAEAAEQLTFGEQRERRHEGEEHAGIHARGRNTTSASTHEHK